MNEHSCTLSLDDTDAKSISNKIFRAANVAAIASSNPQILR